MASYLLSFNVASNDITSSAWRIISLDDRDSAYESPANGHKAIDISGIDPVGDNAITVQIAWVDCDANKQNAIIGVSKVISVNMVTSNRLSGLNNLIGKSVYDTVSTTTLPARTLGIGPMIDLRSSPALNIRRSLLVGLVSAGTLLPSDPIQLIITPTKII